MKKARQLDPHCEAILQEYQDNLPRFREVEQEVKEKLRQTLADAGLLVAAIESRVKAYDSLAGKLELKGHKYNSLAVITVAFICAGKGRPRLHAGIRQTV